MSQFNSLAFNLPDVFGAVNYLTDGTLSARPTSRVTQIVDDLNQQTAPSQELVTRWCPEVIGNEPQVASASGLASSISRCRTPSTRTAAACRRFGARST